ncbi:MAG: ParA family protein, partial [Thermoanaerobaculia bacterium]|nr:ParA family protein [Thermoanaerobaculia bacterium]
MIVAIVSRKGGVGKTTSAVSLAGAFALAGRRTLVVDLDPQASASRSLGVERAELAPSVH